MNAIDKLKQQTGERAVDFIKSGMIVGLGTGTTTYFALKELGKRIVAGYLKSVSGVPSSKRTEELSREFGIPLIDLEEDMEIDITIDGADEIDRDLNMIKGGGGAILREKIIAQNSKRIVIIVDSSKLSNLIGINTKLPVEVLPFAYKKNYQFLKSISDDVNIRKTDQGQFYLTDHGNYIIDCEFYKIKDPQKLASKLESRAGIVEHGLFLNIATDVIIASEMGIDHLVLNK